MPDLSGLGDLVLTVGGDITPLTSALDDIPAAAQQAASQIQAAFDALPSATEGVNQSLANLSTGLSEAGAAAGEAAGHVEQLPPTLHDTADSAHEAESSLSLFGEALKELGVGILTFEGLKEAALKSAEAFGEFQRAGESLAIVTKNATAAAEAMEKIPALANFLGVAIPSLELAQQRFALFGVSLEKMPALLQAAADAARASGRDFDTVASGFERMDSSGKIMARTLVSAGLSMADVAKAMNMVGASSKEVMAAFAALGDGAAGAAARAQVLIDATEKISGAAHKTADDVEGSWQQITNAMHEANVAIGESVDGFKGLGSIVGPAIKVVTDIALEFVGVLKDIADTVVLVSQYVGTLFAGLGAAAADALKGNWSAAAADMKDTGSKLTDVMKIYMDSISADNAKTTAAINKLWSDSSISIVKSVGDVGNAAKEAKDKLEVLTEAVKTQKTAVDAVNDAYLKGAASASQLQTAIGGMANAERALNEATKDHLYTFGSVIKYFDDYRQTLITNQRWLDLVTEAYANGVATLGQYERALKAVKTATDELNGGQTAAAKVSEEFEKLNLALSKAQDYLAAVTDAMAKGQATAGMYQSAVSAVNTAQAALTGSTQTATAAISSSTPKVIDVTAALNGMAAATSSAAAAHANFVGPVQNSGGAVQVLGTSMTSAVGGTTQLINGVQVLTGSLPTLKTGIEGTTTVITAMGGAFRGAAMDAQSLVTALNAAAGAAKDMRGPVQAAGEAAMASAESLGSYLDRSMTAKLGSISVGLKPGDQYSANTWNPNVDPGGAGLSAGWGSGTFGPMFPNETMTFDPGGVVQKNLNNAATNLTNAGTALSTAATAQQTAAWAAADAAKMATAVSVGMVGATNSLNSTALRAADAANQQAMNNMGFASVMTQVNAVTAGTAQALSIATNTMIGAASVVAQIATKAGVQFFSGTLTPAFGSQLALPNVSSSGPSGAYSPVGMPFAAPVFASGPQSNVTVSVNGSQFVQSLMNEFVRNLQTQGIRLTRG